MNKSNKGGLSAEKRPWGFTAKAEVTEPVSNQTGTPAPSVRDG